MEKLIHTTDNESDEESLIKKEVRTADAIY